MIMFVIMEKMVVDKKRFFTFRINIIFILRHINLKKTDIQELLEEC